MTRSASIALLVLLALPLGAQELSIFDLNDFVDPREFGASATSRGEFTCPCTPALISRAILGWDHHYVNVMAPTRLDVGFGHLATSVYYGKWQLNLKTTIVRQVHQPPVTSVPPRAVPRESAALQIARYTSNGNDPDARAGRLQATWRISRYRQPEIRNDRSVLVDQTHHEFGVEYDLNFLGKYVGSVTYTAIAGENPNPETLNTEARLAYVQRFRVIDLRWLRLEPVLSAGVLGEKFDFGDLRRLTVQPSVRLVLPVGSHLNVNVRYAPSFQRHFQRRSRGGDDNYAWDETHELAVFVDAPIFTKLFKPK